MADIRIPTVFDLMPPTLVAVRNMGGSATKSELLEKVPDFAGVNDEQLAVVFPEDSSRQGKSKVFDRIRWACSQAPWPAEERRAFNIISDPVSDHHLGDPCASSPPNRLDFVIRALDSGPDSSRGMFLRLRKTKVCNRYLRHVR